MNILITGGQGFVGRHLASHWLDIDPDARIVSLGRSPERPGAFSHRVPWMDRSTEAPLPPEVARAVDTDRHRYVPLDLGDTGPLADLLADERPDVLVHLAGALMGEPLDRLLTGNVATVGSLFDAIETASVRPRVVLGSSGGVHGVPTVLPIPEDAVPVPAHAYTVTKRAGEDLARVRARQLGLPLVLGRIFNPVGPGLDPRHLPAHVARQVAEVACGHAEPVIRTGALTTTRDLVDVRDLARATRLAALHARGVVHLASGIETPIREVVRTALAARPDLELRHEEGPPRPSDVPRHVAEITALRALGFAPRYDLAESMAGLIDWYVVQVAGRATTSAVPGPTPGNSPPTP